MKQFLRIFFLCDCSTSMKKNGKFQSMNNLCRELLEHIRDCTWQENDMEVKLYVVQSTWKSRYRLYEANPMDIEWEDLSCGGNAGLGSALRFISSNSDLYSGSPDECQPSVIVFSDGMNETRFQEDFECFRASRIGIDSKRIAVSIGDGYNIDVLRRFANTSVFSACDVAGITSQISCNPTSVPMMARRRMNESDTDS